MGVNFSLDVHRRGFFPKGQGSVTLTVSKPETSTSGDAHIQPLDITERGKVCSLHAWCYVGGGMPLGVGEAMLNECRNGLNIFLGRKSTVTEAPEAVGGRGGSMDGSEAAAVGGQGGRGKGRGGGGGGKGRGGRGGADGPVPSLALGMDLRIRSEAEGGCELTVEVEDVGAAADAAAGCIITATTDTGCIIAGAYC